MESEDRGDEKVEGLLYPIPNATKPSLPRCLTLASTRRVILIPPNPYVLFCLSNGVYTLQLTLMPKTNVSPVRLLTSRYPYNTTPPIIPIKPSILLSDRTALFL